MKIGASPPMLHRGVACFIAIFGTLVANRLSLLLIGLLVVLILLSVQKKLSEFVRFGWTTLVPIGSVLVFIWGFVRRGAPGGEPSLEGGLFFAVFTTMRLALLGAIFLVTVLALSPDRLTDLLNTFGIRGRALAVLVSCVNLWSDFHHLIRQVYIARCARGLMPNRKFTTRARQLPYAVRTLFISALTYSLERTETWESSGLIDRLDRLGNRQIPGDDSRFIGILLLALSIAWATAAVLCLFTRGWILPVS